MVNYTSIRGNDRNELADGHDENHQLMDSFSQHGNVYEDEDDENDQFEDAKNVHLEDDRLMESNSTQSQDPNDFYREPSSSSSGSNAPDLEMQRDQSIPRPLSARERVLNVLHHFVPIKQTYERINNGITTGRMQANTPGRFIGQGTDGVFRNLMAKPDTESNRQEQETHPPSYEEAAADSTPEYWESTVISPMYQDEVFVEGLPVGNIASFVWNGLVTVAFQFVGFVLCYLLHTSHAAKQGSRAGLGITLAISGYGMVPSNFGHADKVPERYIPSDPNSFDITKSQSIKSNNIDNYNSGLTKQHTAADSSVLSGNATPYFAYGLIAFGIFVVLKSLVDFGRVKQMENAILSPNAATTTDTSTNE